MQLTSLTVQYCLTILNVSLILPALFQLNIVCDLNLYIFILISWSWIVLFLSCNHLDILYSALKIVFTQSWHCLAFAIWVFVSQAHKKWSFVQSLFPLYYIWSFHCWIIGNMESVTIMLWRPQILVSMIMFELKEFAG